jgi:hypothetical protein
VVTTLACFCYTRGCGCNGHPAFPTPSSLWGEDFFQRPGRVAPRGRERVSGCRYEWRLVRRTPRAKAESNLAYFFPLYCAMDCFVACAPHNDEPGCLTFESVAHRTRSPRPACGERSPGEAQRSRAGEGALSILRCSNLPRQPLTPTLIGASLSSGHQESRYDSSLG